MRVESADPCNPEIAILDRYSARLAVQAAPVAYPYDRRIDSTQDRMNAAQAGDFAFLLAAVGDVMEYDLDLPGVEHLDAYFGREDTTVLAFSSSPIVT
jgi:hypothetical protein